MEVEGLLKGFSGEKLSIMAGKELLSVSKLFELLEKAVKEEPSILFSEGRLIREGYNEELDKLRDLKKNSKSILDNYRDCWYYLIAENS